MRLAEHVEGTVDVDGMLSQMTPKQFCEWIAKDRIEPIGHSGTQEVLALFATMIAAFLGAPDVTPNQFLHWRRPEKPKEVSHELAIAALQMIGAKKT